MTPRRLWEAPPRLSRFSAVAIKVVGLAAVLILTLIVFRLPIFSSLQLLFEGALGDKFALSRTVVKATPMIFTGLGMAVAWRAGAYNIGGEGQFILGGLAAAAGAKAFGNVDPSPWEAIPLLLVSMLGGAMWAGIAGWLQVKRGVEAVISTILLNFIALQLMGWLIEGPLQETSHRLPETSELSTRVMLYRPNPQMDLHAGTLLAVIAAVVTSIYLFRTKRGFELRFVGANPLAARANRIGVDRVKVEAFLLSGLLCGLAGGVEYTGVAGLVGKGFNQNWGFLGIPVALLAGLNPMATVVSALYFGALLSGSENLGRFTSGGPTLVYIVQAAAVLAFVGLGSVRLPRTPHFKRSPSTL
jgi:ABC-type uncharacterized transport system permease subunit